MTVTAFPKRVCVTAGCGNPVGRWWSPTCSRCRQNTRRNGSPTARAIKPSDIKPYETQIRRGILRLPHHLRQELDKRMENCVSLLAQECAGILAPGAETDSIARVSSNRKSASFLIRCLTSEEVTAKQLVIGTAARWIYRNERPDAFPTDRAFTTHVLRFLAKRAKVRGALIWVASKRRYANRTPRDLSLIVATVAGRMWLEAVAEVVVLLCQVATRHERQLQREAKARANLSAEIAALPISKPHRKKLP